MQPHTVIEEFVLCEDLQEVWHVLVQFLDGIGFDRIIFASRDSLSEANFHNHDNMVLFSTYGERLVEAFIDDRMYINSPTVRWALENSGWISWGETATKLGENQLTIKEEEVVITMRNLGLVAGYTYSVPFKSRARYRSLFGLAVSTDDSQEHADALIDKYHKPIETVLLAFVLAVSKFQKVDAGQRLSPVQIRTLSLLAEGRTLAEIAERELVHFRTIDKRLSDARKVLSANNSLHAVVLAERGGQLIIVRD